MFDTSIYHDSPLHGGSTATHTHTHIHIHMQHPASSILTSTSLHPNLHSHRHSHIDGGGGGECGCGCGQVMLGGPSEVKFSLLHKKRAREENAFILMHLAFLFGPFLLLSFFSYPLHLAHRTQRETDTHEKLALDVCVSVCSGLFQWHFPHPPVSPRRGVHFVSQFTL